MARVLERAAQVVEDVQLRAVATNPPAIRLYASAGFRQHGRERRALKGGDAHHDDLPMALSSSRPG